MKHKRLKIMMNDDFDARMDIFNKKSHDYADDDCLSNFKRMGKVLDALYVNELPPELAYCMTLVLLKIDRTVNLIKRGVKPDNESIEDTMLDMMNYIDLFKALYIERNENVKS